MIRRFLIYPILVVAAVIAAIKIVSIYYPEQTHEALWVTKREMLGLWYGKEIQYVGLHVLRREDLEVELPINRSALWWNFNQPIIKASLGTNPLVAHGDLARCNNWSFRCFVITVQERKARFIADIENRLWVLGDDGAFIAPLPKGNNGSGLSGVTYLNGLSSLGASPDAMRAQLVVMKGSIDTLENETSRKVKDVTLKGGEEFEAQFEGSPLKVTFETPKSEAEFRTSAQKLNRVLQEFKGKEHLVKSIDLAFHKMAVVKLEQ